ncbi:MAG: hypothetical protein WC955_04790 [Elusimicrobiota bacterium]
MLIVLPIVITVLLVFLGYVAMWSANRDNVPKHISQFGNVMSIILFVTAALVLIFSLVMKPGTMPCMGQSMGFNNPPNMEGKMSPPRPGYLENKWKVPPAKEQGNFENPQK